VIHDGIIYFGKKGRKKDEKFMDKTVNSTSLSIIYTNPSLMPSSKSA